MIHNYLCTTHGITYHPLNYVSYKVRWGKTEGLNKNKCAASVARDPATVLIFVVANVNHVSACSVYKTFQIPWYNI